MKRALLLAAAAVQLTIGFSVHAFSSINNDNDYNNEELAVGGYLSMGTAAVLGDGYAELYQINPDDKSLSYSAGGGAYFDYYLNPRLGVEAGLGFLGKGLRYTGYVLGEKWRTRARLVYMEIPISLKFNIDRRFQITAGIALWVALSGKEVTHTENARIETDWSEDRFWAPYHRANVGPKISFAYAVKAGPVHVVPGVTWMLHLINDFDNDDIQGDTEYVMREMNIMLNVGVEWCFR